MAELGWHVEAEADLAGITDFISRDSPINAALFVRRIVATAELLREHPQLGRVVPEIGDATYRELIFQNYRIVYRVFGDLVVVLGVVHSSLDFPTQVRDRGWLIT